MRAKIRKEMEAEVTAKNTPRVSVIMPVWNCDSFVGEAVQSIVVQDFPDWELIVVDDASTDQTAKKVISINDPRIRLIQNETNRGVGNSLNTALATSRGEYVARMDGDDISAPDRLSQQVLFMEAHPEVGICGGWMQTFGHRDAVWRYPTDCEQLRCALLFRSELAHPTVMIRRSAFPEWPNLYRPLEVAEDYDFWARASNYTQMCALPKILVNYRLHESNISKVRQDKIRSANQDIHLLLLHNLAIAATNSELDLHWAIARGDLPTDRQSLSNAEAWLLRLAEANREAQVYKQQPFEYLLFELWFHLSRKFRGRRISKAENFLRSPLARTQALPKRILATAQVLTSSDSNSG